jgi:predicted nucleotidyltransferase
MLSNEIKIPEGLGEKYIPAFVSIAEELYSDPKIKAAIVSGSILRGEGHENSDIDLITITDKKFKQRLQFVRDGIYIEQFIYSEPELRKSFKNIDYQDMHMVAYGTEIFSRNIDLKKLRDEARFLFEKGPQPLSEEEIKLAKYIIWDSYIDVKDIINEDSVGAIALMNKNLWEALEKYFEFNNKWFCKPKRMFESVNAIDKNLYLLLKSFYETVNSEPHEVFKIYENIIAMIIKPYPIDEHFVWQGKKIITPPLTWLKSEALKNI